MRVRAATAAVVLAAAACASDPGSAPRPPEPGDDVRAPAAQSPQAPLPPARSPADAAPPLPAPPAVAGPRGELARVGGRTLTTADLGEFVLRYHPGVVGDSLDRLVRTALVEAEAAREGVAVPAALVRETAERALDARLRRVRLDYGASVPLGDAVRRSTGRTIDDLRDDLVLAVRVDLLRQRLARLDALRRDGIELRVLVCGDERTAASVAAQWRDGADAGLLATRLGLRPPQAPPPVDPADVPDATLRARLAAASPGAVLEPVAFEEAGADPGSVPAEGWQVFKVVRTWKASQEPWGALSPRVEDWLRDQPADDAELAAWDARAARRAGVATWDRLKGFGPSPPAGTMGGR